MARTNTESESRPREVGPLPIEIDNIPVEKIPAALAQLAAASQRLAARLLVTGSSEAQSAPSNGQLLNIKGAAVRMGCSTTWLYRMADTLPFTVRVGRSLRFSESGIERWIKGKSGR